MAKVVKGISQIWPTSPTNPAGELLTIERSEMSGKLPLSLPPCSTHHICNKRQIGEAAMLPTTITSRVPLSLVRCGNPSYIACSTPSE